MDGSSANLWSLAGSLYALTGAALLFAAFTGAHHSSDIFRSGTDEDTAAVRFDARLGAALLALGFFFQASGSVVNAAPLNTIATFLLLGLALGLLIYGLGKDVLITSLAASATQASAGREPTAAPRLIAQSEPSLELEDQRTVPLHQRH